MSASRVLGLKLCATIPGQFWLSLDCSLWGLAVVPSDMKSLYNIHKPGHFVQRVLARCEGKQRRKPSLYLFAKLFDQVSESKSGPKVGLSTEKCPVWTVFTDAGLVPFQRAGTIETKVPNNWTFKNRQHTSKYCLIVIYFVLFSLRSKGHGPVCKVHGLSQPPAPTESRGWWYLLLIPVLGR